MTFEDAYFKKKVLKPDSLMAEGLEARLSIDLEGKLTGQVVDIDFDES